MSHWKQPHLGLRMNIVAQYLGWSVWVANINEEDLEWHKLSAGKSYLCK